MNSKKRKLGKAIRQSIPRLLELMSESLSKNIGGGLQHPGWVFLFLLANEKSKEGEGTQCTPNPTKAEDRMLEIINSGEPSRIAVEKKPSPRTKSRFLRFALCCASSNFEDAEDRLQELHERTDMYKMFQVNKEKDQLSQEQISRLIVLIDKSIATYQAISSFRPSTQSIEITLKLENEQAVEKIVVLLRKGVGVAFPVRRTDEPGCTVSSMSSNRLQAIAASVHEHIEAIAEFSRFLASQSREEK
jgi:hypothetical protein